MWTPAQYLWHVVDVLRFGVERLWTLDLDPDAGAMPWDENQAMAVRARSPHSVPVGLHALGRLAEEWGEAAWGAPAATTLAHPELGPLTRDDVVHRNAHEVVHHELDVRRGLGLVAAS